MWVANQPALAHSLWLLVLLKLVTPPFVTVPLPWPAPAAAPAENAASPTPPAGKEGPMIPPPAPAEEAPVAPAAPADAVDDDWSGVLCCSAMRPRNRAEYRVLDAHVDQPDGSED